MRRVIFALLGEAIAFAALVVWFELGHTAEGRGLGALGVFAGVLAIGFPSLYYCCKRRQWEVWRFILLGAIGGALCALPFYGGALLFSFLVPIFALAGAGFGLLFWFTAIWRNDDLTCPKSFCLPCGKAYKVVRGRISQSK
jgi:hypothetical protein